MHFKVPYLKNLTAIQLLRLFIVMLTVIMFWINCRNPEAERKIDTHLKYKMQELARQGNQEEALLILFSANEALTEKHKIVLEKRGITVLASIGNIYTAKASPKAICKLAAMRWVTSIEASKELKRKILTGED